MPIDIVCPACRKKYRVKDELAGKRVKCRECRGIISVEGRQSSEVSESGAPIYRHTPRQKPYQGVPGDSQSIEPVSDHVEKFIGPIEMVFHELVSDLIHVDVHHVLPTNEKPYHTLVTSGMSDLPMKVPEGAEEFRFAELLISLPPSWPMAQNAWGDERHYWPIRGLKMLARMPHEYDTWLTHGHTIPNGGENPVPFADNTQLCCWMIMPPVLVGDRFRQLRTQDKLINFYSLMPLYRDEIDFKLKRGFDALLDRLDSAGVTELLDIKRKSVC